MKPIEVISSYLNAIQLANKAGDQELVATATRRLIRSMSSWRDNIHYMAFQLTLPETFFGIHTPPSLITLLGRDHTIMYVSHYRERTTRYIGSTCHKVLFNRDTPCEDCICPPDAMEPRASSYFLKMAGERYVSYLHPIYDRSGRRWLYSLFISRKVEKNNANDGLVSSESV